MSVDHVQGIDEPIPGGVAILERAIAVYEDSRNHGLWVRIQREAPRSRALKL